MAAMSTEDMGFREEALREMERERRLEAAEECEEREVWPKAEGEERGVEGSELTDEAVL